MSDVFYLVLRRMRFPLLLIIAVYSCCTIVLAMIPGIDPATGQPGPPMSVFEAFYVVSYTSTTIGFGEVPHPYSSAQRMWMTFTIYVSVSAWSYSLFNVIALLQDRGFQNAVRMASIIWGCGSCRSRSTPIGYSRSGWTSSVSIPPRCRPMPPNPPYWCRPAC